MTSPQTTTPPSDPLSAVKQLRDSLAATTLPADAADEARAVVNQLDDYILPAWPTSTRRCWP